MVRRLHGSRRGLSWAVGVAAIIAGACSTQEPDRTVDDPLRPAREDVEASEIGDDDVDPDGSDPERDADVGEQEFEPDGSDPDRDPDVIEREVDIDVDALDVLDLGWRTECAWAGTAELGDAAPPSMADVAALQLDVDASDLDALYGWALDPDERVPARFELHSERGDESGTAEVRLRGNTSRALAKKSFNVRLDRIVPGFETDHLNLNAMFTDPSLMRERLALWVFAQLGVITPGTAYVDLNLGDSYEGLYVAVERVDDKLLADHGIDPHGATMVRDRTRQVEGGPRSMLAPNGQTAPSNSHDLEAYLRGVTDTRGTPDWDAVTGLVEWTRAALADVPADRLPPAQLAEGLAEHVDLAALADFAAGQTVVGDVDWIADDYWLVRPAGEARFLLAPWDKDLSFGSHWSEDHGGSTNHMFHLEWELHGRMIDRHPLTRVALAHPEWRGMFHDRVEQALDETFSLPTLCALIERLDPVVAPRADRRRTDEASDTGFARHGAQHFAEPGHHDLHVATLLDYAQRRAAYLRAEMDRANGAVVESARHDGEMTATARLGPADVGTSVLFTDESGWTIARLDVLDVVRPGTITVSVAPSDVSPEVDRRWSIDAGEADVTGRFSVYFRNNVAHGDWYRPAAGFAVEAIGRQPELVIGELDADGELVSVVESVANPYADRVMARLRLSGRSDLAIMLPRP